MVNEIGKLIGIWAVRDVTPVFREMPVQEIIKNLADLDKGIVSLEQLLAKTTDTGQSAPVINVEILSGGEMKMAISQSLKPDLPAIMCITAASKWELNGNIMVTIAIIDTLSAQVTIDRDNSLSEDELAEMRKKTTAIENSTMQNMKNDPQWTKANAVSVIYSGRNYFLTRGKTGNLMLHQRKE